MQISSLQYGKACVPSGYLTGPKIQVETKQLLNTLTFYAALLKGIELFPRLQLNGGGEHYENSCLVLVLKCILCNSGQIEER